MLGCPASVVDVADPSTGGGSTSGTPETTGGPSSTDSSGAADTSTTGTSTGAESSSADACVDVEPVDNPEMYNCSLMEQDCPPCYKCTHPWDGGNETYPIGIGSVCVPYGDVGLYEPCSYGDAPGVDDCGAGSFCWSPDESTTDGYCIALCGEDYTCPEGSSCSAGGDGQVGCMPTCDPFDPACPDPIEECLMLNQWPTAQCIGGPSGLPATVGEECMGYCGEGLACVTADSYGPGCEFELCCTDLCDAEHPCSNPEQECAGECGEAPEGLSACTVPTPPDPTACPPEGAEPNYPWCSESAGCDELWGGGDDCVEVCFCDLECETPADCPTPATGNPTVECEPVIDGGSCVLSCANGETCPDGMYCDEGFYPGTCMWFIELEPGCTQG
ncbi:MAG: hypothetical protein ACE37F_14825 [Nannocystaceae bacterium]|nr:hypothetical protein [bacterium]